MKNSVADPTLERPIAWALLSLIMLMGSNGSWASDNPQNDDTHQRSHCDLTDQKQAMLSLINEARSQARHCGDQRFAEAKPLTWNCRLEAAAERHSQDMAENDYFSHTDPHGAGAEQRVNDQRYAWRAVGENIAAGHTSASAAVAGWLESPGHCANIMNGAFTEMGMAKADNPHSRYTTYWTQTLGGPR